MSNITNGAKIREQKDPSSFIKKKEPTTFKAKKRIQLQNIEDNSIVSNVNTPHFKNIAKSSTSKNNQLFEKIASSSSVTPNQRYSCVSSSQIPENTHKENRPPSSKPKRHSRNKSFCLENEQHHLVFANNPLTVKNDSKKKQTLHIKKVSSSDASKLTYAQIIKQKKKGKSSLQELIEKQLQQKVLLQQKLAQDQSHLSEKNCTATTNHTLETAVSLVQKKFQEHFKKQLKTEYERKNIESLIITPKMQTKVTRSVPTEYNNMMNEITRKIPKSPELFQGYLKKRNNSQTISHDLDVKVRKNISRPAGHKRNSHSMSINPKNNSPIKKKQDPHASFATDFNDQHHNSQDFSTPADANDACLRENLIKTNKESFENFNMSPNTSLDYYRLVKVIGKGSFGVVYLGIHLLTGQNVAIKTIEKRHMQDEHSKRKVLQEISIIKNLNHTNIVKLFEVFENNKYIFLVLEHVSQGDLLGFVKQKGRVEESTAKKIFAQVIAGVKHCHQNNILHRDLKLDNILLDKNFNVKICDFGVSRTMKEGLLINEQCGTPAYIAPEIINNRGYRDYFSDIWSLGIVLFAMLTGTVPFKAFNIEDLHKAIFSGKFTCPDYLTPECQNLIHAMLKLDPYSRITLDQIMNHEWLKTHPKSQLLRFNTAEKEIAETIVQKVNMLGYTKEYVLKSLKKKSCNHASTCYFLLHKKYTELAASDYHL